jgi:MOSC domain-containing protein YiiM
VWLQKESDKGKAAHAQAAGEIEIAACLDLWALDRSTGSGLFVRTNTPSSFCPILTQNGNGQAMRVISVNVGTPRDVPWQGRMVRTAIFKDPIEGPVSLRRHNLDGDAQADLSVHGGPDKAVYAYPAEHYPGWQVQLNRELQPGIFGENLTTEGLVEDHVHIGDVFRFGTAQLVVTQPRMPCYKLGLRFNDPTMVKTFLQAGHPGIYFAVREEGVVAAGDSIQKLAEDAHRVTVTQMLRLILDHDADRDEIANLLEVPSLAAVWRREFKSRLAV